MARDGLQLFGGSWTERKLGALDQYLRAYTKALSRTNFQRIYIDAFAGTGYREQRPAIQAPVGPDIFANELGNLSHTEPQQFLDGSAKIALKVDPPFHQFIFVELDDRKSAELAALKTEFPSLASAIEVRTGDANKVIREICSKWDRRGARGVLFLDPFGMQAEWATVDAIAKTGCVDTWILFPFATNRLMTKSYDDIPEAWRTRLDKIFGSADWKQRFYKERILVDIFTGDTTVVEKQLTLKGLGTFYNERLQTIFPKVAPNPCVLYSQNNRPLFQLFFAAGNSGKGGDIAIRIAKHILEHI